MFDDTAEDLTEALRDNDEALTFADAVDAVPGGELVAEQAVQKFGETQTVDGTEYIVSTESLDEKYDVPTANGDGDSVSQDADDDAEQNETQTASYSTGAESTTEKTADPTTQNVDLGGEERDFHAVNGIKVDVDPAEKLAGQPTGDEVHGVRKLTNDHPDVPDTSIPYYPVDLGGRDTEDMFYRCLSLDLPVILEGEAGTGKNQLVRSAGAALNLPTYRQEFGADTSVFDVVGERDLDGDDGTYFILGKLAKAAMFGGIYVADEINMAHGDVTSYLHPVFEDRGARELDLRGTGITLQDLPEGVEWDPEKHLGRYIHPDFYAVGTCNPLHYADTKQMNDAMRDRCVVIEHPYLAESETDTQGIETEASLVAAETGADAGDVQDVVRVAAVLRESRREGNALQTPIGHRPIRDTVQLAGPNEGFMSFREAAEIKMVGQAAEKGDKQFIADTIADEL